MSKPPSTPTEALKATDDFFKDAGGFGYDTNKLTKWLSEHVRLPKKGPLLDICCGDGIWSKCFDILIPGLELHGIDISEGAVNAAKNMLGEKGSNFVVGDTEKSLPYDEGSFSYIFARGAGLFNQHDMTRTEAIKVLEMWHRYLTDDGVFCGIYGSTPELMGEYTPMDEVKLPLNMIPRATGAVEFCGGKFHHTVQSFLAPFWAAENIEIIEYKFVKKKHVVFTRKKLD